MIKVTVTHIPNTLPVGSYQATGLDKAKATADFLIKSVSGGAYYIDVKSPSIDCSKFKRVGCQLKVTERQLLALKSKFTFLTDF